MRITSIVTYFLPFLTLFLTSLFITYNYGYDYVYRFTGYDNDTVFYISMILISIAISAILYILLRKQALLVDFKYFKYLLIFLPLVAETIRMLFAHNTFYFMLSVLGGGLLYFSYILFSNRYVARLTENSIHYENLFGQKAIIPLTSITKLEEKKNILTFLKELKFLGISQQLGIAFCDENLDEYEINIFVKVFNNNKIFTKIIEHSNNCGNFKIRQYSL